MSGSSAAHTSRAFDLMAMGLSGLCLIHCLVLPVAFAALPFLGMFNDHPLIHQGLAVLAAPISVYALARSGGWRHPLRPGLALVGLGLLWAAAFWPPFHDYETVMSVAGAVGLAGLHVLNIRWPHGRRGHADT
ncbi:MerC domain-containing protein [Asticcacaulis sp. BYS171W]|uniref:MerC domain-containing protein n=1 Tax=Asticcacaulis aquaticus TaxID=2984212 RepID=A0ABT5HYV5_9CAUL|nr:MerC domain-containing protein [Asticcacaulis aquaticus]MDC7684621.1 MerC domain-containing protein [Asticcacaulis aquaticus]